MAATAQAIAKVVMQRLATARFVKDFKKDLDFEIEQNKKSKLNQIDKKTMVSRAKLSGKILFSSIIISTNFSVVNPEIPRRKIC
jgi:hypothetical protein